MKTKIVCENGVWEVADFNTAIQWSAAQKGFLHFTTTDGRSVALSLSSTIIIEEVRS